jgi:acetamidase/formamidase
MADHLDASQVHYEWNNALPPRLEIEPGETVTFDTRDAADRYYRRGSTHADVMARGPFRGHPLTGPVRVKGARPGDVLVVEILDVKPGADFGWTAIRPGRGLLPESDFSKPFLQIWDLTDGTHARSERGIAVPIEAFPGVVGVALDEAGAHSTMPPRKNGGNMDIKQLTAGTRLMMPVWVDGALFSVGDGHAAQGDGEVCVTAVEMAAHVTLRFDLEPGRRLHEPQFRTPATPAGARGPCYATTAHGPDLHACAQQAIRYMIDHLVTARGLSREEAYILSSVCVDLRISEIVDAPNWIVSAFLPESVFV